MRFAPSKAALAVAAVIVLAVGAGAFGISRLLNVTTVHYHAANTAADLKFDLSVLGSFNDQYASATPSQQKQLVIDIAQTEHRIGAELTSLNGTGFEPSDTAAIDGRVDGFISKLDSQRLLAQQGHLPQAQAMATQNDAAFAALAGLVDLELSEVRGLANQSTRETERWVAGLAVLMLASVGGVVWWDGRRRRWTERNDSERRNRARFEAMVEHSSDLLVVTSSSGADTYISPALEHILGYAPGSSAGLLHEILDPADRPMVASLIEQVRATGRAGPADCRVRHADGTCRTMELALVDLTDVPEVGGVLWSSRDVTDRRELERQLEHSTFSDPLTGLANWTLFRERLNHAVVREANNGHSIAVMAADLDGFKAVNDTLGHDVGDSVLLEVGARLSGCLRPGDTIARLGGDEFGIVLEDGTEPAAERVAERMLEIMRQPFAMGDTEIRVGVSIGIAHSSDEAGPELLRNAEIALNNAKSKGHTHWAVFEPIMHREAEDHLRLSIDLDEAIERGQLEVYYQPTVSIATGEIQGAEALVRWHHPTRGLTPPALFIPIAEETGQIVPIGRWVLQQACRQAHSWHLQFPDAPPMTINVNLSGRQLADDGLVGDVRAILIDTGLDSRTLALEITESVLMHDVESVRGKLQELKDLGVRLAIDDFGTGYSSLAYLSQFPVDILKIDRSFVVAADDGAAGGQALVRAIVELSASLHLSTVAEGIELKSQADLMLALGCATGQGFLFAHPMPPEQLQPILEAQHPVKAVVSGRRRVAAAGPPRRPFE